MHSIYVTLDTFHLSSGWLKESARKNILDIVVTLDTSQLLSGWLKELAPYEYYAREDAQSETVCGARCFVRERFTHVNITDVALEGTTESTRREAPGVAEREGPCAALCPGG